MKLNPDQRAALADFVRARREALSPQRLGLPPGRRRTPGLRREEVAQLAGLSTTWYTWLEQGRDMAMSAAALSRLAEALALNAAERAFLFELSRHRDPREPIATEPAELPEIFHGLVAAATCPAYVIDRRWRARSWNEAAGALLRPWLIDGDANLLRFMFLSAAARRFISDWEERARRLIAEFRAEAAPHPDDREIATLIAELSGGSPDFVRLWNSHSVLAREGGVRRFNDGGRRRTFEQLTFAPIGYPDYKLVTLLPAAGA